MSKFSDDGPGSPQGWPDGFAWSRRCVDGVDVIYLAGELDLATAPDLRQRLMGVAESDTAAGIVLDLSKVLFIDAHCIGLIVSAWAAAKARGRWLRVDGLHGTTASSFDALGLEPILVRPVPADDGGSGTGG